MQVPYERCCGLDVHKRTVVACVVITSSDSEEPVQKQVRTLFAYPHFSTGCNLDLGPVEVVISAHYSRYPSSTGKWDN